jgi:two-component system sensor histidine kinase/response regulator
LKASPPRADEPPRTDERGQELAEKQIVVIDDDYAIRLSCSQTLTKTGYDVTTFADGASGVRGVMEINPELVVVDLKMAGISGFDVIERVHEFDPNIVIVVITGYATINTAVDAMKAGAYDFLAKPFKPDELRIIVARGLERRRLLLEAKRAEMDRVLMKRRFVTFVSHQLKTPLVAVHQYLDVLVRTEDQPAARRNQWLERCLERTREMQAIIDDWLMLAKIEKGSLARETVAVELKSIVSSVVEGCQAAAQRAGVTLRLEMPQAEYRVNGDRTCLSVLIENLVSNAVKYNKPGGNVTVRGARTHEEVTISVADTGIGVSDDDLPFLFDEFFRGRNRDAARTSGTGLGLAICKRIVTEMGGSIEVASKAGEGSTFLVRLPAGTRATEGGTHATEAGERGSSEDTGGR